MVDTTSVGDAFTRYFISAVSEGKGSKYALKLATATSSLAVSTKGAEPSIPVLSAVLNSQTEL